MGTKNLLIIRRETLLSIFVCLNNSRVGRICTPDNPMPIPVSAKGRIDRLMLNDLKPTVKILKTVYKDINDNMYKEI
jgi:hypothetical protein